MLSSKVQGHTSVHKSGYAHGPRPVGTTEYVASTRDTLRSIAVAFDTTTTTLMKLNKMSSLTIFPGQTLFVPCDTEEEQSQSSPLLCEERTLPERSGTSDSSFDTEFSFLSPLTPSTIPERQFKDLVAVSSKPEDSANTHNNEVQDGATAAERRSWFRSNENRKDQKQNTSQENEDRKRFLSGNSTESEPFEEGFLKMNVRYITEKNEMVNGVLLVTPAALMYDPDGEDPVVKRDGCDDYGIMCPMHQINCVAMYNDTAKRTSNSSIVPVKSETNKSEENQAKSPASSISSDTTTEAEAEINEEGYEVDELPGESAPPESTQSAPSSPIKAPFTPIGSNNTLYEIKNRVPGTAKLAANVAPDVNKEQANATAPVQESENKGDMNTKESKNEQEKEQSRESKLGNEFPLLHAVVRTVEELLPGYVCQKELGSVPPTLPPDCNHMYLCIRSQRRMVKTFSISEDGDGNIPSENNQPADGSAYPEYWFQVARKKSDLLYAFFLQWSSENREDTATELGFIVMDSDCCDQTDGANNSKKRIRSITNSSLEFVDDFYDESYSFEKEWEIISIQEAKRRSIAFNAIELAEADDSLVPELEKPSNLLTDSTLLSLCKSLPNRCIGYSWSPVYTTSDHGTSLKTMYRSMANSEAPVVLIVQDTNDHIFGALCSSALKVSDHYYGTGESFLFTLEPHFEVFQWTGENSFFMKGDTDCLTFGGGRLVSIPYEVY